MAIRNNPFKEILNKIPGPFRNKYFLALGVFFLMVSVFSKNDMLTQYRLLQTVNKLDKDEQYYEAKIEEIKGDRKDIEQDKEKFAREHYYMKKNDEDVFIIVDESDE